MKRRKQGHARRLTLIWVACGVIVALGGSLGVFAHRNLTADLMNDKFLGEEGAEAGFVEHQAMLPDGTVLNYGEGPSGGIPLMLIHGQSVSWTDYAPVLPQLSERFHVFAVDVHGHGASSKDPAKYRGELIGEDLAWFLHEVIGRPAVVSGHSSGALLTAWLAANSPDDVLAAVLEDGPFFTTEPGRAEQTFAWLGFQVTHEYLKLSDKARKETSFTRYSLERSYFRTVFDQQQEGLWENFILKPALKRLDRNPHEIPRVWYYPPELGVNLIYALTANLQDGTDDYDLRFGVTFYDFSWFEGFDQADTLARIRCPTVVMHVAPSEVTAPSYRDENGILLSAMDATNAERVAALIPNATLLSGYESMHDIHADQPEQFVDVLIDVADGISK